MIEARMPESLLSEARQGTALLLTDNTPSLSILYCFSIPAS